ncbi:MAG: HAD family hydrolase [Clostridia bacterium]|nr:HAD family hydrolase [Clostridia bacterium]
MKKAILFDLDATIIQFDQKTFEHEYFKRITKRVAALGYNHEQFVAQLNKAIKAMYKNDGSKTNQQVFENTMAEIYTNQDLTTILNVFNDFYNNNYDGIKEISTPNKQIKQIIDWCKQNFDYVLLTTNPFFPRFAVETRLGWTESGLTLSDFDWVTTYETSHFSKPNPKYFEEVLTKFNLQASDCIMVGNNELEDYITATQFGMEAFLVGNHVMPYEEAKSHPQVVKFENLIEVLKVAKQK